MIDWSPDALAGAIAAIARIYGKAEPMDVNQLIDAVIDREGGYVDNPADRGGPTNMGITEQLARAHGYQGAMRDLPRAAAEAIYRAQFWTDVHFDQVAARYPRVGEVLFDAGVNHGTGRAATWLQRVLNVLNRQAADYPDIAVDGGVGRMTLAALDGYRARRGDSDAELELVASMIALRQAFYIGLAEATPSQEGFEYGWTGRIIGLIRKLFT